MEAVFGPLPNFWARPARRREGSSGVNNAWSTPLDPRLPPEEKAKKNFTNSRAIIDACRPFHWRDQFPKVNMPSAELAKETRERFSYLLD